MSSAESLREVEEIPITLRAELDRRTITVRELLEMTHDTLVPLSRPAGENVDLYAGDVYLGNGEILVADSMLSVRVADIGEGVVCRKSRA